MTAETWSCVIIAYLLGSIPTAYIVGRLVAGVDIRKVGDGNVGAKNVYSQVGPLPGIVVGLVDVAKGALAVLYAKRLALPEITVLLAGFVVVLAHDWMILLRFRGGQGMAAGLGTFLVLLPREAIIILALTGALLLLTRRWNLSWSVGFGLLPILAWLSGRPSKLVLYPVALLPTVGIKKLIDLPRARRLPPIASESDSELGF